MRSIQHRLRYDCFVHHHFRRYPCLLLPTVKNVSEASSPNGVDSDQTAPVCFYTYTSQMMLAKHAADDLSKRQCHIILQAI